MASQNMHNVQGEDLEPHPSNPQHENTSVRGAVEKAMKEVQEKDDELPEDPSGSVEGKAPVSDSEDTKASTHQELEIGDLEPPSDWTAQDQEVFRGVDKETQAWLLERDKATRTTLESQLSALQPFQQVQQTWNPYIQQLGKPTAVLFDQLMNADYVLRKGTPEQKQAMLGQIVRDYGIQVEQPQQSVPEEITNDPVYGALGGQLQRLSEGLNSLQNQMQTQFGQLQSNQANAQQQALEAFKLEQDAEGKLKHPYYQEVEGLMNALAQDALANGRQTTLEDVYQQACRANPETWAKIQSANEAAQIRERQKKASEKKAASKSVSSSPSGSRTVEALPPKKGETVRQTVERAFAASSGGGHA